VELYKTVKNASHCDSENDVGKSENSGFYWILGIGWIGG